MANPTLEYHSPKHTPRGRWVRRAAIGLALYPVFLLAATYGTWLAACAVLGRRPHPVVEDPSSIHPALYAFALATAGLWAAAWPAMLVYAALVGTLLFRRTARPGKGVLAAYLAAAVAPWAPALLLLEIDPGHVILWIEQ